ncbi:hypothetical protein MRX96_016699 [Rhipicephalus microplus]
MVVPPETIAKIQNQRGKVALLVWKQISSTQSFWCEVHSCKDACGENPFAELARFSMSMLVLPYSNAEVERAFGQFNMIKSKLRSKLKPETTKSPFVVRAGLKRHQKSCFDYEFPVAVSAIGDICNELKAMQTWQVRSNEHHFIAYGVPGPEHCNDVMLSKFKLWNEKLRKVCDELAQQGGVCKHHTSADR